MCKPSEYQNMLTAVMHPHTRTGYKDSRDACNKTDRHNGGDYRRFERCAVVVWCGVVCVRRAPGKEQQWARPR
jgi:hypothetical protein